MPRAERVLPKTPVETAAVAPDGDRREPCPPASTPGAAALLRVMVGQDGAMTRPCQALAGTPVELRRRRQRLTDGVPPAMRGRLPGSHFVERVRPPVAAGWVLTDNLVYVALHGLDAEPQHDLLSGRRPVGQLLDAACRPGTR